MRAFLLPILFLIGCAQPDPAAAQARRDLAPFRSVSLSNGGEVVIRHGATQSVTIVSGSPSLSVEGDRLLVDHCRGCPSGRRRIEIVTSALDSLSVDNGGRIVLAGTFPTQAELSAAVSNGGAIDARPLEADRVRASVTQGGSIMTQAARRLDAAVSHGGLITYWGNAQVSAATNRAAGVVRGRDEDLAKPLADLGPLPPPHVPPAPKLSD